MKSSTQQAAKKDLFEALCSEIAKCTKCTLHEKRLHPVPGEGSLDAELMLVGEGPGVTEDKMGRPFVGQAGKVLDQLLESIGLHRNDVFIGNAVKCRPPGNRTPHLEEIKACEDFLLAQIAMIEPQIIVLLGNAALTALLGNTRSISQVRGSLIDHQGMKFFPVFHPAASLYRRETYEQMKKDFLTLNKLMKENERQNYD